MVAQSSHFVFAGLGGGMTFTPSELTISLGDTVFWLSESGTHDVNFNINSITGESFGNPAEIASASLPTQSIAGEMGFIVFNTFGTFNYDCSVGSHAALGMVGQITVFESIFDCLIPEQYSGNTGSNMTVMLTPDIFGAFPSNLEEDAYVVAVADNSDLVVGSVPVFGVPQASVVVWGDDAVTSDIDGASSAEIINYYLVNGDELFDLDITSWTVGNGSSYVTNGVNVGSSANITFICSTDEESQVGIIEFYPPEGSTYNEDNTEITLPSASLGESYSQIIEIDVPDFLTIDLNGEVVDLPINFVEITNVTMPNGMTYSCSIGDCYFGPNTSGDITLSGTPTESGINELVLTSVLSINATPIGIPVDVELTIPYTGGNVLLDLQLQGDYSVLNDAIPTFYLNVEGGEQLGCTDPLANNYDDTATEDDGSCQYDTIDDLDYIIDEHDIITTCGGTLFDSGGSTGQYTNNENQTITIYPENDDEYVSLFFSEFQFEGCCDYLTIYDGETVGSPILVPGSNGTSLLEQTFYASPENETGALTITFTSDGSVTYPGWAAEIGCTTYGPCFGYDVDVISTYESEEGTSDATATVNISLGNEPFDVLWSTGETTETITGLTAGLYNVTISDSEDCIAESSFEIVVDPLEYNIDEQDAISSCGGVLYDSGGPLGAYTNNEDQQITIFPESPGQYVSLFFSEFEFEGCCDYLTIYDGESTNATVLVPGSNGSSLAGQTYTASETNESGALTITFTSDGSVTYPGWAAEISCTTYVVYGCMEPDAFNYNADAEEDDGSCYYAPGCTDEGFVEFYTQGFEADYDNGDCITILVDDCTNDEALNYNPNSTFNVDDTIDPCVYNLDDWMCGMYYKDLRDGYSYPTVSIGEQCWMAENLRYVSPSSSEVSIPTGGVASQLDDGFVYTGIDDYDIVGNGRYYSWGSAAGAVPYAWHLPTAEEFETLLLNYNGIDLQLDGQTEFNAQISGQLTFSEGMFEYIQNGNSSYLWSSTELDQSLASAIEIIGDSPNVYPNAFPKEFGLSVRALFGFPDDAILGCTDDDYVEYNPQANYDDGSCEIIAINGCTNPDYLEFNVEANLDDGTCLNLIVEGCTDEAFFEYDSSANVDDGTCSIPAVYGCIDATAQNYNDLANLDDGSCIPHVLGCTDDFYAEYDPYATLDDNSCETEAVFGCIDINSINYDVDANVDDGSCVAFTQGCMNPNYIEFNALANFDDGSCATPVIYGCTIDYALNYNALANSDDGSCEVEGCTNSNYVEYDINANIDDGSCLVIAIPGCTNSLYLEYFPPANFDNGSCTTLIVEGCTNPDYLEYTTEANFDDGSCITLAVIGCTDPNFLEFDPDATIDNNLCLTPLSLGCTDISFVEYNIDANIDDGSCITPVVMGCTDNTYLEYWSYDPLLFSISNLDPIANTDDGSCTYIILEGCTDENFIQYNALANVDNNSCEDLIILGCTDVLAFNYDPYANTDNGLCEQVEIGCMDENYLEYNPISNIEDNSMCLTEVVFGCNDEDALNYNPESNTNDESCIYYLAQITFEMFANGIVEFNSDVLGMGSDYTILWDFGDGSYSNDHNPTYTYVDNGLFEVVLHVSNGLIEVIESIQIEIINAIVGIDEYDNNRIVISNQYFDLMGREVCNKKLNNYQVYIQKINYDDGSHAFVKNIKLN